MFFHFCKAEMIWVLILLEKGRCRNCVQQYYHAIIEENSNDPKEMWRTINKVLNKDSPSSFSAVNFQGQRLDRPNEIAEAFNEHFVTIGPKLASNI